MLQRDKDIYASVPMRRLHSEQMRVMQADLQRCSGTHALQLGVAGTDNPPALTSLGCWARLWIHEKCYRGDLYAAVDEPLPFLDDAFELVLLRHVLEVVPAPSALLAEAMRVLAPGGMLALTGLHPFGGWAPWLLWKRRGSSGGMQLPLQLRSTLQQQGFDIELIQRVGRVWPGADASSEHVPETNFLGGGYVIVARKRRRMSTPLRVKPKPVTIPVNSGFSPGTRRSASS